MDLATKDMLYSVAEKASTIITMDDATVGMRATVSGEMRACQRSGCATEVPPGERMFRARVHGGPSAKMAGQRTVHLASK